jgi:hypothetical protein
VASIYLAGLLDPGVAPHPPVQAEQAVRNQLNDQRESPRKIGEVDPVMSRRTVPEVEDLGHGVGGEDDQSVDQDEEDHRANVRRGYRNARPVRTLVSGGVAKASSARPPPEPQNMCPCPPG